MPELDKLSVELEASAMLITALKKARAYIDLDSGIGCLSPMIMREILITARNIVDKCEKVYETTNRIDVDSLCGLAGKPKD